jgi:hypothetical protein
MRKRTFLISITALIAVAAMAAVALAAASVGVFAGATVADELTQHKQPVVDRPDVAQAQHFGVLRRAMRGSDAVPAKIKSGLAAAEDLEQNTDGFNIAQARKVADGSWIAPGYGAICKVDADPNGLAYGFGVSCADDDDAMDGRLVSTYFGEGKRGGETTIVGVVPNGVDQVTITRDDGGKQTADVIENAYTVSSVMDPVSVSFTDADGSHKVALGQR